MPVAPGTSSCLAILVSSVTLMSLSVESSTTVGRRLLGAPLPPVAGLVAAASAALAFAPAVSPVLLSVSTVRPVLRRPLPRPAGRALPNTVRVPADCAPRSRARQLVDLGRHDVRRRPTGRQPAARLHVRLEPGCRASTSSSVAAVRPARSGSAARRSTTSRRRRSRASESGRRSKYAAATSASSFAESLAAARVAVTRQVDEVDSSGRAAGPPSTHSR